MALTPPSAPLSRLAGEGTGGEGWVSQPTDCAVGYTLPPAPRAQFFNELLTHDARFLASLGMTTLFRRQHNGKGALGNKLRDSGNVLMQGPVFGHRRRGGTQRCLGLFR
ncbi:hypothetical protein SBA2_80004 [Acidobacteriia bacterium SbA2]|nr:hypothetical protein SBA2_80004 [Acidobacteriia bacterium SbA2]